MCNKKVKGFIITCSMLLISMLMYSQPMPKTYFEASSGKLNYGFYIPENYDSTKIYPLVMYLHGFNNTNTVYLNWYNSDLQAKTPCFVYTPKTPPDWADWSGWNDYKLSEPMTVSIHVLDSLIKKYPIDTNRLYVYGISMGGEGTFDLLHKLPHKFAAAMSVCGGGQEWWADSIANTPFWMFHGSIDNVNPPKLTERVYNRLVAIGAKRMRYTNYPGYGHTIWYKAAVEPAWNDWMFSFSKKDTSCPKPNVTINLMDTAKTHNCLSWNDTRNANDIANKIWYYTIVNQKGTMANVEFNKTSYVFAAKNPVDTIQVRAVNYCFAKSNLSNSKIFKNVISNSRLPQIDTLTNVSIYCSKNELIIESSIFNKESEILVELMTIDGKSILRKNFPYSDKIVVDISSFSDSLVVVSVKQNNRVVSKIVKR